MSSDPLSLIVWCRQDVQSGSQLRAFIDDCVLQRQVPPSDVAPDTPTVLNTPKE